jgi:hypothetical protein
MTEQTEQEAFEQIYAPFLEALESGDKATVKEGFQQDFEYIARLRGVLRGVQLAIREAREIKGHGHKALLTEIEATITKAFPEFDEGVKAQELITFLSEATSKGWIKIESGRYVVTPEGYEAIKEQAEMNAGLRGVLRHFAKEAEA